MNVKSLSLKLDPRTHDDDSNGDDYDYNIEMLMITMIIKESYHRHHNTAS